MPQRREPTPRMLAILDAAVRVVVRGGLRGLTHRAVDAEAGLPEGSTSGSLRTRLALLTALAEHVAGRISGEVDQLAEQAAQGLPAADVIAEAVELFARWSGEPDLIVVRTELALEAMRQAEISDVFQPWRARMLEVVEGIIASTRSQLPPAQGAPALVAAMEGVLLSALGVPAEDRADYVRETAGLLVGAFVVAD